MKQVTRKMSLISSVCVGLILMTFQCNCLLPEKILNENECISNYLNYFSNVRTLTMIILLRKETHEACNFCDKQIKQIQKLLHVPVKVILTDTNSLENNFQPGSAFLVMTENKTLFLDLGNIPKFWKDTRGKFVFTLNTDYKDENDTRMNAINIIFKKLWCRYKLLNILLAANCTVWKYNPFSLKSAAAVTQVDKEEISSALDTERLKNLNGYPLKIALFSQYPLVYLWDDRSLEYYYPTLSHRHTHMVGDKELYKGLDGQTLVTLSKFLNFTPFILKPLDVGTYGFLINGSLTGSLRDIVLGRADVSFNSRFIKDYGVDGHIEFSTITSRDRMCVIVPKAKLYPQWKNMLHIFDLQIWSLIGMSLVTASVIRCLLQKFNTSKSYKIRSRNNNIILETFRVFLLGGISVPPRAMHERCFFASMLFFSMIIMNIFQGLLVTTLTFPIQNKDIQTLDELDHSGLPIWSRSPDTADVFKGEGRGEMIESLLHKFSVFHGSPEELLHHIANLSDAAALIRESSSLYTEYTYINSEGKQLIHTVRDCPAYYFLAYIFPVGSPILPRFNILLGRIHSAGLDSKWYLDGVNVNAYMRSEKRKYVEKEQFLKVFGIEDLFLAFLMLAFGLVLSTCVFIFEIILAKYLKAV